MAANPLPRHDDAVDPIVYANAATATTVNANPGQEIEWQNNDIFPITIQVSAVNGVYPFADNNFPVPAKANNTTGTWMSNVLPSATAAQYPFTRVGMGPMGGGKIIIKSGKP